MKIIQKHWFTELSRKELIGVIIKENDDGERKAYIGTGSGYDEARDADHIVGYGAKLTTDDVRGILKTLEHDDR